MNTFGKNFRVSIFGESHGEKIGVVIDGVKPGLELSEEDLMEDILRRKSGAKGTTPRIEADKPLIVSGLYNGKTTGAPLAILFDNTNTHSSDYSLFKDIPRPGHADYTASLRFDGYQDPRGGGHFSGRLTLPVVAAGAVAKKMLGASFRSEIISLGGETDSSVWQSLLEQAVREGDSLGAVVECVIEGVPAGIGNPFWDSVESLISHAVFAIPGVRGVEFGDGFAAASMKGSEHNDPLGEGGIPLKNGSGGINGGITNGAPIVLRVAFKPTSSIRKAQTTWNFAKNSSDTLSVPGRHDVCFALRAPVVVEAVCAIVLADLII